MAWKWSQKLQTFKGAKSVTFFTFDGTYGDTNKILIFVENFDANGVPKTQYYVKNNDKTKTVSDQKAQQTYMNELKTNANMANYVKNNNLDSKIDN